jgi:serine/threonine protein kinase
MKLDWCFTKALAGKPPFEGNDTGQVLRAQLSQSPAGLCKLEAITPVLESVVLRLLAVDPSQRYQRASAAAHDLEEIQAGRTPVVGATGLRPEGSRFLTCRAQSYDHTANEFRESCRNLDALVESRSGVEH